MPKGGLPGTPTWPGLKGAQPPASSSLASSTGWRAHGGAPVHSCALLTPRMLRVAQLWQSNRRVPLPPHSQRKVPLLPGHLLATPRSDQPLGHGMAIAVGPQPAGGLCEAEVGRHHVHHFLPRLALPQVAGHHRGRRLLHRWAWLGGALLRQHPSRDLGALRPASCWLACICVQSRRPRGATFTPKPPKTQITG